MIHMLLNTHYEHIFVLNTYAYIYMYIPKSLENYKSKS